MSKKIKNIILYFLATISFATISIAGEVQWMAVGDLHSWFHSGGCEIEVGRTFKIPDQQDGMRWPAQFRYQDNIAAKALWIGCKNFDDPVEKKVYEYKVVHAGPRVLNEDSEFMMDQFSLAGKFDHPAVLVDGQPATKLNFMETVTEEPDESIEADRVLTNVVHTSLGITMKRTIYASSRKEHSNYFIYDYVFENTGVIDLDGTVKAQILHDVVFFYQFRYAISREGGPYGQGYWLPQATAWGINTMNDVIYTHPVTGDPFRAFISWHGKHSAWAGPGDNIGGPNYLGDGHFGASQFAGVLVLHADTSPQDQTDAIVQPTTTWELDSDHKLNSGNSQYNASKMTGEYQLMTAGRPSLSHALRVGGGFADAYGSAGGFSTTSGFGPYTIAPGERIHIVLVEAVAGLDRRKGFEVGAKWVTKTGPYDLPGGGTTSNNDVYKNAWVMTGRDSLIKTFEKAQENYLTNFDLPQPPPPPQEVTVNSGGDRITITWAENVLGWTGTHGNALNGYRVYRGIHQPDTTYEKIFECGPGTDHPEVVYSFDDKTATRGFDYYYYVTSYDDGSIDGELESSKFYTMTSLPAHLKRPPGRNLDGIRIVPNPYNITAEDMQFGKSGPNRIMFYNIPPYCEIKIYTERGDLIKTIVHDDASGDEAWNSITSSRQTVVSGIYIAYIKVTRDFIDEDTNELVFKKGESVIKKLAIVR